MSIQKAGELWGRVSVDCNQSLKWEFADSHSLSRFQAGFVGFTAVSLREGAASVGECGYHVGGATGLQKCLRRWEVSM